MITARTSQPMLTRWFTPLVAIIALVITAPAARATELKTPEQLQVALASAGAGVDLFTRCAAKADEEGYIGTASLFRAAARAQQIHEGSLTKALESVNVKPDGRARPTLPEVKTTKDNLAAVQSWITGESATLRTSIGTARTEGQKQAETSLNYARQSLNELGKFFRTATATLENTRSGKVTYYVDRTCGYTVDKLDFQKCPVCYSTRDNFEKVD